MSKRKNEPDEGFFLSVRITTNQRERLEKLSKSGIAEISISNLVRKAIENFLEANGLPEKK